MIGTLASATASRAAPATGGRVDRAAFGRPAPAEGCHTDRTMSQADCQAGPSGVPYYSQWESPHLVAHFIAGTIRPADDPAWAASGASTPEEYEFWSTRVCGLACLKMILRSRNQPVPATMRLVEQAVEWKAFIRDGDAVAGLIYRPFADWVRHDYGITARVEPELSLAGLSSAASPETPVMASVHSSIRWSQRTPPATRRAPGSGDRSSRRLAAPAQSVRHPRRQPA